MLSCQSAPKSQTAYQPQTRDGLARNNKVKDLLTLEAPTPHNGQTHLKNALAIVDKLFDVFDHFVGLTLKGVSQLTIKELKKTFYREK